MEPFRPCNGSTVLEGWNLQKAFLGVTAACGYPIGFPDELGFACCGAAVARGQRYCTAHLPPAPRIAPAPERAIRDLHLEPA